MVATMNDQETIDRLVKSCHRHGQFEEKSPSEEVYCALTPGAVYLKGENNCKYLDKQCSWGVRDGVVLFGCARGNDDSYKKDN